MGCHKQNLTMHIGLEGVKRERLENPGEAEEENYTVGIAYGEGRQRSKWGIAIRWIKQDHKVYAV